MKFTQKRFARCRAAHVVPLAGVLTLLAVAPAAIAQSIIPGDLIVTTSTYAGTASTIKTGAGGTILPGTTVDSNGNPVPGQVAQYNGSYPNVFNNAAADPSFGITSPIIVQQLSTSGVHNAANDINITALAAKAGFNLTTSFSSKSELAINLSTNGKALTFMGYNAPVNTLDVSNSNTPGVIEPGNYTQNASYRVVAQLNLDGSLSVTAANVYNGNNPRAAILVNGKYLTVGNAGNGNGSKATTAANGVQSITPTGNGTVGANSKVGSFSVTQINPATGLPYTANFTASQIAKDKAAKDDNYRGETYYNGTLYITKGSGSNGIDSVYSVNTTTGVINVLPGFSTVSARSTTANVYHPFGIWFANTTTLYVADEGDQSLTDTAANNGNAGLEKWSLKNGTWSLDYTLTKGLNLDIPYAVTNLPSSLDPATDGLRNITGQINANGTVTIYAVTSTVSNSGDQGADPNKLVAITDTVGDTTLPTSEAFTTLETAGVTEDAQGNLYGQVIRGVAIAPVPEPGTLALLAASSMAGLGFLARRRSK